MNKIHQVEVKDLKDRILQLVIDGELHTIDLAAESKKLKEASPAQLNDFTISPSGYGIHWHQLDEDLAIDPLIGVQHKIPEWKVAEDTPEYKTKRDKL